MNNNKPVRNNTDSNGVTELNTFFVFKVFVFLFILTLVLFFITNEAIFVAINLLVVFIGTFLFNVWLVQRGISIITEIFKFKYTIDIGKLVLTVLIGIILLALAYGLFMGVKIPEKDVWLIRGGIIMLIPNIIYTARGIIKKVDVSDYKLNEYKVTIIGIKESFKRMFSQTKEILSNEKLRQSIFGIVFLVVFILFVIFITKAL